jgi:hypothetical protein
MVSQFAGCVPSIIHGTREFGASWAAFQNEAALRSL